MSVHWVTYAHWPARRTPPLRLGAVQATSPPTLRPRLSKTMGDFK